MSWIFGTISKKQEDKHKVEHIIQRSDLLHKAESRNSIILAGGNSSTCRIIRKSNLKVIVIGMPFLDKGLLPAIDSKSIGDKLDLIKMKHLYQYFYSPGQAYYDNYLPNIMLGAHNEILSNMMSFSVDERKNSRLNYKIINSASKDLNKIPYVRYNSLMKTPRNIYVAYLKGRINSKLGKVYIRKDIHQLFNKLKPWIYDNLSLVYRQFPDLLNKEKVSSLMHQYYDNKDLIQVDKLNSIAQLLAILSK